MTKARGATLRHPPFTIVLPAGWSRIPIGPGSRPAIKRILDAAVDRTDDPRAVQVRRRLEQMLTAQVRAAQEQSGVELYLPTAQVHGITVPASVVVSAPKPEAGTDPTEVLLAVAARRKGAAVLDIGGKPAVRTERLVAPPREVDAYDGAPPPSRQVVYFLADPDDDRRYLVVSASVLVGEGEGPAAVADAVTELVDAMLTTFRWLDVDTPEEP